MRRPRCAGALQASPSEEHGKVGSRRAGAESTAEEHEEGGGLDGNIAAEDISKLAPGWNKGGGGEVECGNDPVHLSELF